MPAVCCYCFLLVIITTDCYSRINEESSKYQNPKIEFLLDSLTRAKNDSERMHFLNELSWEYRNVDTEKGIMYANEGIKISEKNGERSALAQFEKNLGVIFKIMSDYNRSVEYFLKALNNYESEKDSMGMAACYGNLGITYKHLKNYALAEEHYKRGLEIFEKQNNLKGIASTWTNLGLLKEETEQNDQAIEYYNRALEICMKYGFIPGELSTRVNAGKLYMKQGKHKQAEEFFKRAYEISISIGDKAGQAVIHQNLSELNWLTGNKDIAREEMLKSISLAKELNMQSLLVANYQIFASHHAKSNNFKDAFEYYRQYSELKDSIFNDEKSKELGKLEAQFEYNKKEEALKIEQEKERAVAAAETKRQQLFLILIASIALAIAVIAMVIFRSLRVTKKQKRIIELQKNEVYHQKELVEEKQKEIIDSITYAKRLQEAILPPVDLIKKHLPESFLLYKPKDIVAGDFYWMEVVKEGVIGNQYSVTGKKENEQQQPNTEYPPEDGFVHLANRTPITIFLAAADCTGHGVPGALVSVVCSNALNRAVKEFGLRDTGKILDKVTDLVLETFEKSGENVKDGMDISLLKIKFGNSNTEKVLNPFGVKEIQWSGANNPLWFIQNVELKEITADKQPIGKSDNRKPFTTHTISPIQALPISEGTPTHEAWVASGKVPPLGGLGGLTLYLFTDGFADQFGGPKGKKFKYSQFEKLLLSINERPMDKQKETLNKTIDEWRGNLEQVDDICVIGIRL